MNQKHSTQVGIFICLLLTLTSSICLGDMPEYSGPDQIDSTTVSLIDTISETPSADEMPEALTYPELMGEIDELYSSEILLVNQSHQIDMNNTVHFADQQSIDECICSLSAYESLLRDRAVRLAEFETKLGKSWQKLDIAERVEMTEDLEEMLRHQAIFIYDFQSQLKKKFCSFHVRYRNKFLDSQRDLLDRQAKLLLGFEGFLHNLQDIQNEEKLEFLASFEDLIRRQAVTLDIYESFLKVKCNILKIYKYYSECGHSRPCQNVTFTYVIKNTCNCTVEGIWIVDNQIGIIVEDVSLRPYEKKLFAKSAPLHYPPGTTVCNKAQAWGNYSNNFIVMSESNEVCIQMAPPIRNNDSLKLGNQKALAIASDPATAENNIVIEKNQGGTCCPDRDFADRTTIGVGDQLAAAYRNSRGANNINIVSNQQ